MKPDEQVLCEAMGLDGSVNAAEIRIVRCVPPSPLPPSSGNFFSTWPTEAMRKTLN